MRYDRLEHADHERRHEPGPGAPAGVFLLHGGYHVAAFASRAAVRLHERGALLVAALRFDAGAPTGPALRLQPLSAPRDLPRLGGPPRRN